mmetsp:Transcript_4109/g.10670  ORF Transcript_4109/g.10670 Transcript_4109/m.10670 type:complete len:329 (-) Transcript_4109:109-1095(-)
MLRQDVHARVDLGLLLEFLEESIDGVAPVVPVAVGRGGPFKNPGDAVLGQGGDAIPDHLVVPSLAVGGIGFGFAGRVEFRVRCRQGELRDLVQRRNAFTIFGGQDLQAFLADPADVGGRPVGETVRGGIGLHPQLLLDIPGIPPGPSLPAVQLVVDLFLPEPVSLPRFFLVVVVVAVADVAHHASEILVVEKIGDVVGIVRIEVAVDGGGDATVALGAGSRRGAEPSPGVGSRVRARHRTLPVRARRRRGPVAAHPGADDAAAAALLRSRPRDRRQPPHSSAVNRNGAGREAVCVGVAVFRIGRSVLYPDSAIAVAFPRSRSDLAIVL